MRGVKLELAKSRGKDKRRDRVRFIVIQLRLVTTRKGGGTVGSEGDYVKGTILRRHGK